METRAFRVANRIYMFTSIYISSAPGIAVCFAEGISDSINSKEA